MVTKVIVFLLVSALTIYIMTWLSERRQKRYAEAVKKTLASGKPVKRGTFKTWVLYLTPKKDQFPVPGQQPGGVGSITVHMPGDSPGAFTFSSLGKDGPCAYRLVADVGADEWDHGFVVMTDYYPPNDVAREFPGLIVRFMEIHCTEFSVEQARKLASLDAKKVRWESIIVPPWINSHLGR